MDFFVNIDLKKPEKPINYSDKIMLIGSCFTEHIGNALLNAKFDVLQNPNGILFDPASVCKSLVSYIDNKRYVPGDLFQLHEVWHSWQHHSRFSNIDAAVSLAGINASQERAHDFLSHADWIIITLGSSYSYRLRGLQEAPLAGPGELAQGSVANCHRAPATWFDKHLMEISETISMLDTCYHRLLQYNPNLNIIFTVSPVRHLRDGVIANNRSKARLIEAVHHLVDKYDRLYYFPAYELVIDVLRDYRFYDIDLAHPNYAATTFVLEKFSGTCIDDPSQALMQELKKISVAKNHRAFQPQTNAHRQFLATHFEKVKLLKEKYPFLDLEEELHYFSRP